MRESYIFEGFSLAKICRNSGGYKGFGDRLKRAVRTPKMLYEMEYFFLEAKGGSGPLPKSFFGIHEARILVCEFYAN